MRRILLVEDDRRAALAYEALLAVEHPHVAVDTVYCAEHALLCLSQRNYDLIVSDFKLPGLDGLGLLIGSYCLHRDMRFVLISAYGDRALEESAAKLGAYAVLHKPITPDVFLDVVKRALMKRRRPVTPGKGINRAMSRSLLQDAKRPETERKDWTFLD